MLLNSIIHINLDLKFTLNYGCKLQNTDPDLISLKVCSYLNLTFWLGAVSTRSRKFLSHFPFSHSQHVLLTNFFFHSVPALRSHWTICSIQIIIFLSYDYIISLMRAAGESAIFHLQRHYYSLIFCICRHHSTLEMWLNVSEIIS